MALTQLAVFVRSPEAGRVKTRLIPKLGPRGASELYEAFVEDTLRTCQRIAADQSCSLLMWVAGPVDSTVRSWARRFEAELRPQCDGDLGERLQAAFAFGLSGHERVVLLGSDAPSLPAPWLSALIRMLDGADMVLGPSRDGGYYGVGAARGTRPSFEAVRWSTRHALSDTLSANAGLQVALASPWFDIDEPTDLSLLRAQLSLDPKAAPASDAWLRANPQR